MNSLLLVAGGSGSRFGGPVPKQYLELEGKAVMIRTLERFHLFDPELEVVVVISRAHQDHWERIRRLAPRAGLIKVAHGGSDRHQSVRNGLDLIKGSGVVGIHDAVRPLVSIASIQRCYASASAAGSGIPVIEMDESLRLQRADGSSENLQRARVKRVQTPQCFRVEEIKKAYARTPVPGSTDDASVYEACFGHLHLVEGNVENLKITTERDLKLAGLLL